MTEPKKAERAIGESENGYRNLFSANPHPMWVYDRATLRFLAVNDAAIGHYGYSHAEFLRMTITDIRPHEDVPRLIDNVQAIETGIRAAEVWRHRKRDGTVIEVEIISHTVDFCGRKGELVLANDITERKRAEAALRDREERLRLAIQASNVGLWDWNLATNQVNYSREWKSQIGYGEEEITHEFGEWERRVHPDDLAATMKRVEQYLVRMDGAYETEFRFRHKDGAWRWIYSRAQGFRDADGKPTRMLGCHVDITERKHTEMALRLGQDRLSAIINSVDGIVWEADAETFRFTFVSPRAERLLGYPVSRWIDEPTFWADHIHPEDREATVLYCLECTTRKCDHEFEYRMIAADGRILWLRDIVTVVTATEGRPPMLRGIMVDITERKQADEMREKLEEQLRQAQKMEALGTLAGGIAHDFNNLLAAIIGNAELAGLDLGKHPAQISIAEVVRAGQRARELVQRILTFSRPHKQHLLPIDLQPVLDEAVTLLRSTLPAGVDLDFISAADVPAVRADGSQIHQIILNLATNAWHAMESQCGRICIRLGVCHVDSTLCRSHPELQPGLHVRLSVSDTGKGMTPATLERIFEPFFTTKPASQGAGLGLSVVHGIVRSHGGAIEVESQSEMGSTFHLYFPASAEVASPPMSESMVADEVRGGGEHILYLDDEEPLVFLAVRVLERIGYRVDGYTQAAQALAAFRANPDSYDLVITDYNMPGLSGMEVAKQLLSIRPDALVALASGYIRPDEIDKAHALGIREIILKPNTIDELCPVVRRLLSTRKTSA